MSNRSRQDSTDETDLLDEAMEIPFVNAGVSRLQRVLGPSCLASLVVLLILAVLFRRWVHLPPLGMVMLLIVVWMLVLGGMVRFRNSNLDPDD